MGVRLAALPLAGTTLCALIMGCGRVSTVAGSPASATGHPTSATGASASATPSSSSPPAVSLHACGAARLAITLTGTDAVDGQAGGYLTFTNDGGSTCLISGWPTVTGVTSTGTATALVHTTSSIFAAWKATSPPPVIHLAPGQSAYAIVAGADHPAGNVTSCLAPYVRLRVSPPGSTASTTLAFPVPYLPRCPSITGATVDGFSYLLPRSSVPGQ
jgi:hypothetical protein